jgi:hypothetical protein
VNGPGAETGFGCLGRESREINAELQGFCMGFVGKMAFEMTVGLSDYGW